ncbi:MAG: membrane protein insertase YidC [Alphaproteobacteria bacterium]|jgi:YidC/Oxa1 family membrane protein insertase|nr:membrane protein insertase YidC [Alphaproteobacteria bacterium]
MSDQRNLILAIGLSIVVLLGFQYFVEIPRLSQQQAQQEAASEAPTAATPQPTAPKAEVDKATPKTSPGAPAAPAAPVDTAAARRAVLAKAPRLPIASTRLSGSIATVGRRLDDLVLTDYKETLESDSPSITLLSPTGSAAPYHAAFGWADQDGTLATPDDATAWQVSGSRLAPNQPLTMTWDNGAGFIFKRRYELDENYMFTVTQTVENHSDAAVTLYPWGLVARTGAPETLGFYILHEGPIGVLQGQLKEIDYDDLEGAEAVTEKSQGGWVGITDKYWLTALVSDKERSFTGTFQHFGQSDSYQVQYLGDGMALPAGGIVETKSRLFAGAKEVNLLDDYRDRFAITLFDRAVDFGYLHFLTIPFFKVLDFFYRLLGNFGLAILLLTVCVKLIFFPLANKSYKSMSKMKALQPEMTRLKERYGDDRQKMQQEVMGLYKKEKVNPAAGCLPILIQIPVFFALYKVLFVTIEMRHAPFYGWIHDLSAPDPLFIVTLFGLIPWDPPLFLSIGIWPVLMGLTMFLQQKLNPQPTDPVQAKVFLFMPLFFTFLLGTFPAGLVIYWTWNNMLSIAQQYVIMKRMGVPIGGGKT